MSAIEREVVRSCRCGAIVVYVYDATGRAVAYNPAQDADDRIIASKELHELTCERPTRRW